MNGKQLWKIRLDRLSQTTSVRHEMVVARTTRARVNDNLFDDSQRQGSQPSGSTSDSLLPQTSTLWGHMSLDDETPKAPEAQDKLAANVFVESYPGGLFDTSFLYLYGDHVASHVWKGEVYLFTFSLHMF